LGGVYRFQSVYDTDLHYFNFCTAGEILGIGAGYWALVHL